MPAKNGREKKNRIVYSRVIVVLSRDTMRGLAAECMVARFCVVKYTKTGKIYQMTTSMTKCHKIYQMDGKMNKWSHNTYTSIFHCKNLKNLPKWGFLV
jgi:hypothetical protein